MLIVATKREELVSVVPGKLGFSLERVIRGVVVSRMFEPFDEGQFVERMKLENILSEKENLDGILENLSEGIIAHDRDRHVIFSTVVQRRSRATSGKRWLVRIAMQIFRGPLLWRTVFFSRRLTGFLRPSFLSPQYFHQER